jgi:putative addiction module component (TIGR02574 family)
MESASMRAAITKELWKTILALPSDQRTRLAEDVWASVADEADDGALSDEDRTLLAERMAEESDELPGIPWEGSLRQARQMLARKRGESAKG